MIFIALLPLAFLAQDPLPKADPGVSRASLRHHLEFLASDELKGRGTATPESARVSAYIARSLERSGVQPGQGKSYFQSVPLLTTSFEGPPQLSVWSVGESDAHTLEEGVEFSVSIQGAPNDTAALRVVVVQEEEDLPTEAEQQPRARGQRHVRECRFGRQAGERQDQKANRRLRDADE